MHACFCVSQGAALLLQPVYQNLTSLLTSWLNHVNLNQAGNFEKGILQHGDLAIRRPQDSIIQLFPLHVLDLQDCTSIMLVDSATGVLFCPGRL